VVAVVGCGGGGRGGADGSSCTVSRAPPDALASCPQMPSWCCDLLWCGTPMTQQECCANYVSPPRCCSCAGNIDGGWSEGYLCTNFSCRGVRDAAGTDAPPDAAPADGPADAGAD
jgi:hypothetical protein